MKVKNNCTIYAAIKNRLTMQSIVVSGRTANGPRDLLARACQNTALNTVQEAESSDRAITVTIATYEALGHSKW